MDSPAVATVVIELADDARLARDIVAGRLFVPGCTLALEAECALIVRGPIEEIELAARVVYVDPSTGAGLEVVGYSPALRDHLSDMLGAWCAMLAELDDPPREGLDAQDAGPEDVESTPRPEPELAPDIEVGAVPSIDGAAPDAPAPTDDDQDGRADADHEPDPERRKLARNYYERLRGLTVAQQIKAAHSPDPQVRIVLERLYNKTVWEPLLRNPRLTPPEVARIARMGTVPRVLLEVIVGNGAWLQMPEVRRALLTNPRLGTDQILRVLRLLPKHELKLAAVQTAYPHAVREAARRLLKD